MIQCSYDHSSTSHSHEDYVFDVKFEAENLNAVSKLHNGKAAGPD